MEPTFYGESAILLQSENVEGAIWQTSSVSSSGVKRPEYYNCNVTEVPANAANFILRTPEFKNYIFAQHSSMMSAPSPTQINIPYFVTNEQDLYTRGLFDGLQEKTSTTCGSSTSYIGMRRPQRTDGMIGGQGLSLVSRLQSEPERVVKVDSPTIHTATPLTEIDLESQEKMKLEHKRQRNRIAAFKCRRRKQERISGLEDKVKLLKCETSELGRVALGLKKDVCQLKMQIMNHVHSGCEIPSNY